MKLKTIFITLLITVLAVCVGCLCYAYFKKDNENQPINENNLLSSLNFTEGQKSEMLNRVNTCSGHRPNSELICIKYLKDDNRIEMFYAGKDDNKNEVTRCFSYSTEIKYVKNITTEYIVNLVLDTQFFEIYDFNKLEDLCPQFYQENLNSKFEIEKNKYSIEQIQISSCEVYSSTYKEFRYRYLISEKDTFTVTKEFIYGKVFALDEEIDVEMLVSNILNAKKI